MKFLYSVMINEELQNAYILKFCLSQSVNEQIKKCCYVILILLSPWGPRSKPCGA